MRGWRGRDIFSSIREGMIREKFFEAKYRERLTGNNVLSKFFPELGEEVTDTVEAPHLQLRVEQSDRVAVPGNLVTLTAEVRLPPMCMCTRREPRDTNRSSSCSTRFRISS